MALEIRLFTCLKDNYGVLIHDSETGATATIDAPDEGAIRNALDTAGWTLSHILTTHHHWDHTQANGALKARFGARLVGPRREAGKIEGLDEGVGEGSIVRFGSFDVHVIETPGHTKGHIAYWIPAASVAFVGDTLFPLGCGRVFEGTHAEMWASLSKIAGLPPDTRLYCGHEYTLSNARFALTVEPDNPDLQARARDAEARAARGEPTVPTTVAAEKRANPFLRANDPELQMAAGLEGRSPVEVFTILRERKDSF